MREIVTFLFARLGFEGEDIEAEELGEAVGDGLGLRVDHYIAVVHSIAELVRAVIKVLTLLGFKYERVVVELPYVVAEFALVALTIRSLHAALLWSIHDLVEGAVGVAPAVSVQDAEMREGFGVVIGGRGLLFGLGVVAKTKLIEVLGVRAGIHLELAQELPIILLGKVFAPNFLLFSHVI